MLKLFEVTGFKNFEHTMRLDFTDVRDYKFNDFCVGNDLLNKMIIYGKNSVGKSNLGLAMFDIVSHLTANNVTPGIYDYYLNINNQLKYAEFHYIFSFASGNIDYYYRKNEKRLLIYEKVSIDNQLLFEYNYESESGDLSGIEELAPTLNFAFIGENDSMLKYVVTNTAFSPDHPLYQMMQFISKMLWFRSLDDKRYIGYRPTIDNYFDFIFEEKMLKEFESFLHKVGIKEGLIVRENADGKKQLYFDTRIPLPFFSVASSGTKALYTFFYWYKTAKNVSFMFIDEFDAFYHYELAEVVVGMLEKMPKVQMILTSHNTNLLSNRIMRPDCYFILTNEKLTSFANATNRELREGHNLEKLYMSGEFNG